ncbi:alpha-glucosidase [Paraflavitalea soli]|uniref:Alpha-glucosidase n=2 Tax=Paraflavitalea soli TaxID=2315862 RepID=A0A3B7MZQ9_9BACT|nr:alpha-glucosidase [Paraflavitalea soli]
MNNWKNSLFSIGLLAILPAVATAQHVIDASKATLSSPNGDYVVTFCQKQEGNEKKMYYKVDYKQQPFIGESELDIALDNHLSESAMALKVDTHSRWCANLLVKKITYSTVDTTWRPLYGERNLVPDHYKMAEIDFIKEDNPIYPLRVQIRAYNEGVALRFYFPENSKGTYYRVMAEHTSFRFPQGTKAWHTSWGQGPYNLLPIADWPDEAERPLTLQLPDGRYACIAEAGMVDYARTKFRKHPLLPNTIQTSMYTPADMISPFSTPWRVIMAADRAGDLVEHNYLLLSLNEPSRIADDSWIQPGKIMRAMSLTTKEALSTIDFAAKHQLQYVLFDAGWYGPVFSFSSDATKVKIPDFDLPAILQYAKQKGLGVFMYVNQQALLAQSDSIFRVFHDWGVKGVKFGFVQVGSHRWTTWIEEMFRKAAQNKILVNVHDDWRPTGEQRTWPNLLTAEGIRGNEEMPDATHNTVLPFTRYMAGAADYTICYYTNRIKTTHAHQLALAAVYYSPLLTLYWYDKAAVSKNEPELEFWDRIPVNWDQTKVLAGEPGQQAAVARRKGDEWFVGVITNNDARTIRLPLDFLDKKKQYTATVYADDPAAASQTKVSVKTIQVDAKSVQQIKLQASGGLAIWIRPSGKNQQ